MKYKLINQTTNEEHLCNKVTIDGFDYYVSDNPKTDDYCLNLKTNEFFKVPDNTYVEGLNKNTDDKKVIATNSPNIDIPKVKTAHKSAEWWAADLYGYDKNCKLPTNDSEVNSFIEGYRISQETHPFSEEDMIDFGNWCEKLQKDNKEIRRNNASITRKELLQLWKEQRVKVVYYE